MESVPTSAYSDKVFNLLYAALLAGGGGYAYYRTKSMPSLLAGLGFGILYGLAANYIEEHSFKTAYQLSLLTSLGLAGMMGYRYHLTKGNVPFGLSAMGAIGALNMGYKLYTNRGLGHPLSHSL